MPTIILYDESKATYTQQLGWSGKPACVDQGVFVQIRSWYSPATLDSDVVLHTRVFVDGQITVDSRKAFDRLDHTDAEFQRIGIRCFDSLLAAHPTLGKAPETENV